VPLLIQPFGDIDAQGAFTIMGMTVGDMKGAGVSTPIFCGLYALNDRIKANVLNLANAFKPLFVALKILGTFKVVNDVFYLV
jgi:hypothetical protein